MRYASDFDTLVQDYTRYRSSYSEELFDSVAAFFGPPSGKRVLDAACGTGLGAQGLLERGYAVTGVDVAERMLEAARSGMPAGANAAFYAGRAEALPFGDEAFAGVVCAQAFHWFDEAQALAEFGRVLAPGGGLAIFWKHARPDDPYARAVRTLFTQWTGRAEAPMESSFRDSLAAFWAEVGSGARPDSLFADAELRVLHFGLRYDVDSYVGYHRSRENLRLALGDAREAFLAAVRERIAEMAPPSGAFEVEQDQFLYLARKRA